MTKYVIAVASSRRAKPLRELFQDSSWTTTRSYGPWTIFVHTDAASQYVDDSFSLFKGWYIDHSRERLVFASPGSGVGPAPESPIEGCYVVSRLSEGILTLGHDLFCQLPLLHFCDQETFVASDSMFALSEARKAVGLPCRLNERVARARAWTHTICNENQSDQTLLADVQFDGLGTRLAIDLSQEVLRTDVCRTAAPDMFEERHTSHAQAVRDAAVRLGRHIASFAAAGSTVSCSLSGGHDSRAVAAAASLVAPNTGNITVVSNKLQPREFEVAQSLARIAGLTLGPLPNTELPQGGSPLSRWLAHSAGLYDVLIDPADRDPSEGVFTMGGHGGALTKGVRGWSRTPWLTYRAPLRCQAALRAELDRGLRAMGHSLHARWWAEWHHLGYRNAIHNGRNSERYLFNSSPLIERSLVSLAFSHVNERRPRQKGAPTINTDLTTVLRPEMAAHPYSEPTSISRNYIRMRLDELGGPVDPRALVPYAVIGSPRSASIRSSIVFGDRAYQMAGALGAVDLAIAGAEHCPAAVRSVYDPMIGRLRSLRGAEALEFIDKRCAAKLIALHLID